jgi:hypothetical protein
LNSTEEALNPCCYWIFLSFSNPYLCALEEVAAGADNREPGGRFAAVKNEQAGA